MPSRDPNDEHDEDPRNSSPTTDPGTSTNVTVVSTPRTEDGIQKTLQPDDEFWMEDGNLVLIARDVEFRVYKGPLIANSPVFKDMLSLPQPEGSSSSRCTCGHAPALVHVSDSPEDLRHLLRALVPGKTPRCAAFVSPKWSLACLSDRHLIAALRQETPPSTRSPPVSGSGTSTRSTMSRGARSTTSAASSSTRSTPGRASTRRARPGSSPCTRSAS